MNQFHVRLERERAPADAISLCGVPAIAPIGVGPRARV